MYLFKDVNWAHDAYAEIRSFAAKKTKRSSVTTKCLLISISLFFGLAPIGNAYTVVVASTAAPVGLEQAFIDNATNYIISSLFVNPFVKNTYQITLFNLNPNYVPPTVVSIDTTTWFNNINAMKNVNNSMKNLVPIFSSGTAMMIANSTYAYVTGYANGLTAQVYNEIGVQNGYFNNCASTGTWFLPGTTNYVTLDSTTTCVEVLDTIAYATYQLLYATNTPGGF